MVCPVPPQITSPKAPRVSREVAVTRFLDAVISLMDTKPIPDISIQEIADTVGLNHGYVFRYFGTRLDLFSSVTDELADRALAAVTTEMNRRRDSGETSNPGDLSLIALGRPFTMKRMSVIQYLTTCGVPPARFGPKSRDMIETSVQTLLAQGMSHKMAKAQAFKISIMLWAQQALSESFGVTSEEATELFFLTVDEITHTDESEKRLGWK
jgi:AcrR family transcriptional regulator